MLYSVTVIGVNSDLVKAIFGCFLTCALATQNFRCVWDFYEAFEECWPDIFSSVCLM